MSCLYQLPSQHKGTMRRAVALIFGLSLVVIIKVHCHEYSGPVVNRMNDLTDEVVQMKMDLARLELKIRNQIDLAKISLEIELKQDMQQHVRDVMADIIQGESIEEMVSSQVVSEVRQLKRGNHLMKRQLNHVMNSLRHLQREKDDYKEALKKAENRSPEFKCVIYTEAIGTENKAHNNFTNSPLQHLTMELQSIKMEQDTLNISVSATGQGLMSARSEMKLVQASVNVTGEDVLSMKSELTQLQASLNDAEQDILSTRTDMRMVQASVNVTGKDVLLMKSELTQFQALLNVLSTKSKFAAANTSRLSAMEERIVQLEKAIKNIDRCPTSQGYTAVGSPRLCFKLSAVSDTMTWTNAQSQCQYEGGRLIVLNTEARFDFINQYMYKQEDPGNAFVGMKKVRGAFKWTDGTDYVKKWGYIEPDYVNYQNCAAIWKSDGMGDIECFNPRRYLCEIQIFG